MAGDREIVGIYLKVQNLRYHIEKEGWKLPIDLRDRITTDLLRIENELSYLI